MQLLTETMLADFTVPLRTSITMLSTLWLLPLVAAISIVYKATKIEKIKAWPFLKEVILLFGSIIVFMLLIAVVVLAFAWLVTE